MFTIVLFISQWIIQNPQKQGSDICDQWTHDEEEVNPNLTQLWMLELQAQLGMWNLVVSWHIPTYH